MSDETKTIKAKVKFVGDGPMLPLHSRQNGSKMSQNKATKPTIWSELHDPKEGLKLREIPFGSQCEECGKYDGHQLDCTSVTVESMVRLVLRAQRDEEEARKRADRNWNLLTKYQGKLAVLKHENNKLRAANKKLKQATHDND